MASNIANVGPLIIALIRHIIGQSSAYEVPSICVIYIVGITVPIILSLTWFKQVFILGASRSLYLLVLGFFLALVNCTSSVTYLPFVNRFDPKWLNIYFAGESLSSLLPAMLGLLQVRGTLNELPRHYIFLFVGCWTRIWMYSITDWSINSYRENISATIFDWSLFSLSLRSYVYIVCCIFITLENSTKK